MDGFHRRFVVEVDRFFVEELFFTLRVCPLGWDGKYRWNDRLAHLRTGRRFCSADFVWNLFCIIIKVVFLRSLGSFQGDLLELAKSEDGRFVLRYNSAVGVEAEAAGGQAGHTQEDGEADDVVHYLYGCVLVNCLGATDVWSEESAPLYTSMCPDRRI
jgi:hypothetical protein